MLLTSRLTFNELSNKLPLMTYVLGARCSDGVVLIADKKFTNIDDADPIFDPDKLTGEIPGIISAFSGDRGTFELFRTNIRDYVRDFSANNPVTMDKLVLKISDIIFELNKKYFHYDDKIEVLLGISGKYFSDKKSVLKHFSSDGKPIPIHTYKAIGSGTPFGSIYLTRYYEGKNMEQIAQLGYFIIKYIEQFNLDKNVGVGRNRPDIACIPDDPKDINKPDYVPTQEVLDKFERNIHERLAMLKNEPFLGLDKSG